MKVKLGDITKIRTGKLDANASSKYGEYPFFTCSKETLKIDSYSYDCECVLVSGNGDLNVKYYNGKFDAYQRTYIIEEDSGGKLFMPYLYYFFSRYVETLRQQAIGGVIKYIKLGNLTDACIELCRYEKQIECVNILDKVNLILDKRKYQLEELETLIKSRFIEMFGDVEVNPYGWKQVTIGSVIKNKVTGWSGKGQQRKKKPGEIAVLKVSAVTKGYFRPEEYKVLDDQKNIKKYVYPEKGDLLFSRANTREMVGATAIIKKIIRN